MIACIFFLREKIQAMLKKRYRLREALVEWRLFHRLSGNDVSLVAGKDIDVAVTDEFLQIVFRHWRQGQGKE